MRNLRPLLGYVRPHAPWLLVGSGLMVVVGLLEGATALLAGPLVQLLLQPQARGTEIVLLELPNLGKTYYLQDFFPLSVGSGAFLVVAAIVSLYLVKAGSEYLGEYSIHRVGYAVVTDLRNQLYAHTIRQSLSFFHRHTTGRLLSATINDIDRVQAAVSHVLTDFFRQVFALPVLLVLVLVIDWRLASLCFLTAPFIVLPVWLIGHRVRRLSRRAQEELGELSQALEETYGGVRIVQAFGTESWEAGRFGDRARRLFETNLRWVRHYALASPLMEVLGALTVGILLLFARARIHSGVLTAGMMSVFVVALIKVYQPVKRLGGIYSQFQQALGASEKVFEILVRQEEVGEKSGAVAPVRFSAQIEFDRVWFSYAGEGELLRDISLTVRAGEVVALVGSSGAGKTTLVNLLPRFFDVTRGCIWIDERDLRDVPLAWLRSQFAIVTQETVLFNDTVRANISYGRLSAPEAEVRAAAEAALAHEFVSRLPRGYDTRIGERGMRLSGGQRQRIAIARALLKNAPILILDEATSELDTEAELLVQHALANLMAGRTVLVIAHRLSTVRRADKIVVLEDGTIREEGTHQDLLARGGLYQRLYDLQFVDLDGAARGSAPGPA